MSVPDDDHLTRAMTELGDPESLFQVSRGRFLAKLGLAAGLLLYGVVANYLWWAHGPATFGHFEMVLLVIVPLSGVTLLWHMYRNRGLFVLIYPRGLLRLRRGEVASFPWAEVDEVRVKVQRSGPAEVERDEAGRPIACWLVVDVPTFQIWNAGLTVTRGDGEEAHFGPALTEYDRLAEAVQRRTFVALWPGVWERFRAGESVEFGDLEAGPDGLRHEKKLLPWHEVKELAVAQGKLSVKQAGKWLPWVLRDVTAIPNPHVLFALAEEARKIAPGPPRPRQAHARDHDEDE